MSDISMILDRIGNTLAIEVSPHLDGHYAGGHVVLSGLMAVMAVLAESEVVTAALLVVAMAMGTQARCTASHLL